MREVERCSLGEIILNKQTNTKTNKQTNENNNNNNHTLLEIEKRGYQYLQNNK